MAFILHFIQSIDLSPGDLLYYGGVEWLNISDFLGKIKKGLELHAMCFVFKTAVVFLCKERLRQKKKSIMPVRELRENLNTNNRLKGGLMLGKEPDLRSYCEVAMD